jgi:hypothetical protein
MTPTPDPDQKEKVRIHETDQFVELAAYGTYIHRAHSVWYLNPPCRS